MERFPYEPSKEEITIFEYVFFPQRRSVGNLLTRTVPRLMAYFLLMVNVTSITYGIATAPLWSSAGARICGSGEGSGNGLLITISAAIEGVMLSCSLLPAAYFFVQLTLIGSNGLRHTGECCTGALSLSLSLFLWVWASALQPHTHTHSHTLFITCTCGYDEIKGTHAFSCSFSFSLSTAHTLTQKVLRKLTS